MIQILIVWGREGKIDKTKPGSAYDFFSKNMEVFIKVQNVAVPRILKDLTYQIIEVI